MSTTDRRPRLAALRLAPLAVVLAAFAVLLGSCGRSEGGRAADSLPTPGALRVVVTIPPLEGLIAPLLPEGSEIRSLVPPGASPHGYELTPGDAAVLARADLVVYVGLGLEPGVVSALARRGKAAPAQLCMAEALGIGGEPDHGHDHAHHDHDDDCDHDHGPIDEHLWLDPVLVASFVAEAEETIGGLLRARSAPADALVAVERGAASLRARVAEVDAAYRERLSPHAGAKIVTQHAAWGRLAERYGFVIARVVMPVEAHDPSPGDVAAAAEAMKREGVAAVFSEPQLSRTTAERLARLAGVPFGELDPVGDTDWARLMMRNLDALESKLAEAAAARGEG
ncbi:MAG: zinc ABC transporter substrate-binding protein [Phycisphaeraceae bacterium]|nr:zinc ABC transporter substrate-binding protein [Phycisphaeraceae bacterium]